MKERMMALAGRLLELTRDVYAATREGRHDGVGELLDRRDEVIEAMRLLAGDQPLSPEVRAVLWQVTQVDGASAELMERALDAVRDELTVVQRGRMALARYGAAPKPSADALDERG